MSACRIGNDRSAYLHFGVPSCPKARAHGSRSGPSAGRARSVDAEDTRAGRYGENETRQGERDHGRHGTTSIDGAAHGSQVIWIPFVRLLVAGGQNATDALR